MGPPGTLQVAQKLIFSRILLKSPKCSIISLKQWIFTKFNGILVISRFWWSHGSGPSIWPRKNKRFVKGRGFMENSDFLILVYPFYFLWFSIKVTEIHEFTGNSKNCKKIAPLRRRVKTAVIQRYFNHSGAHFLPRTSQNQFFGVSSAILLKFTKLHSISLNLQHFMGI